MGVGGDRQSSSFSEQPHLPLPFVAAAFPDEPRVFSSHTKIFSGKETGARVSVCYPGHMPLSPPYLVLSSLLILVGVPIPLEDLEPNRERSEGMARARTVCWDVPRKKSIVCSILMFQLLICQLFNVVSFSFFKRAEPFYR